MLSKDLESRILSKAQEEGLLKHASPEALDPKQLLDPFSIQASSMWGPRLDALMKEGVMSTEEVASLAFDLLSPGAGEAPTPGDGPPPALPILGSRYEQLMPLGEGATSHVYRAFDTLLHRWVALKFLKVEVGALAQETLNEARAQAQVEHPNVCRVYEVGETEGRAFIAMQLVEGQTLSKVFRDMDLQTKVRLVRDLAEGVHAAHRKGLIHLDLKPGNVLVQMSENGEFTPLLTDFGMMRSESSPVVSPCPMGTPPYSSPEQIAGDLSKVDRRSDVYSLGILLYVLLTEAFPFEVETFSELLEAIRDRRPTPLRKRLGKAPEDLQAIVDRCLEKNPIERYDSAQSLADDLQRFLAGEPVQARNMGFMDLLRSWARRNRKLAWVVSGSLLAFALATGVGIHQVRFAQAEGRWAAQFEQDVDQLETTLAQTYAQPTHDARRDESQVREYLKHLRAEMDAGGRAAAGPGHYACARIHRLLGEELQSWDELDQAWASGLRTPPMVVAYAESLIGRFKDESSAVDWAKPHTRIRWNAPLEARYLVPATKLLRQARGSGKGVLNTRIDIALAEATNDYPGAIQVAETYRKAHPWDYRAYRTEVALREAFVWFLGNDNNSFSNGSEFSSFGATPPSRSAVIDTELKALDELTLRFLKIAPSDPEAWRRQAGCVYAEQAFHPPSHTDYPQAETRVFGVLDKALGHFPEDATLLNYKSRWIMDVQVPEFLRQGIDPLPAARTAQALRFQAAQQMDPSGPDLIKALCLALPIAQFESLAGNVDLEDWKVAVHEMMRLYPRVRPARQPEAAGYAYYAVGSLRGILASRGEDASEFLAFDIQLLTDLEKVEPYNAAFGDLYTRLAKEALQAGRDPWPNLAKAETRVHALFTVQDPEIDPPPRERLWIKRLLVLFKAKVVGPGPSTWKELEGLEREIQDLLAKGQLKPWEKEMVLLDLGSLHSVWAELLTPDPESAKAHCARARAAYRGSPSLLYGTDISAGIARLALMEARFSKDPEPLLKEGLALITQALEPPLSPSRVPRKPGSPLPSSAFFVAFPSQGLELKGELEFELAKLEKVSIRRRVALHRARTTLSEALRHNRNLEHQIAPLISQINALIAAP